MRGFTQSNFFRQTGVPNEVSNEWLSLQGQTRRLKPVPAKRFNNATTSDVTAYTLPYCDIITRFDGHLHGELRVIARNRDAVSGRVKGEWVARKGCGHEVFWVEKLTQERVSQLADAEVCRGFVQSNHLRSVAANFTNNSIDRSF